VVFNHVNLVGMATQKIYGENLVVKHIPEVAGYLEEMKKRPAVQQVEQARMAALAKMMG
jgi:glutathione S-transferase